MLARRHWMQRLAGLFGSVRQPARKAVLCDPAGRNRVHPSSDSPSSARNQPSNGPQGVRAATGGFKGSSKRVVVPVLPLNRADGSDGIGERASPLERQQPRNDRATTAQRPVSVLSEHKPSGSTKHPMSFHWRVRRADQVRRTPPGAEMISGPRQHALWERSPATGSGDHEAACID